ncbi:MAG TPA: hypothetical protein VM888_08145 [Chitinophagaceae bacterium]|nr:hypothetical protein [Chitinophagaceae bacterium]
MKNFKYLQIAIVALLLVGAVSCTVIEEGYYEEDRYSNRNSSRYYDNQYYGSTSPYIILERDPWTGRYYQASPGRVYGTPYGTYDNRTYNNSRYNNRRYDNRSNSNTYRNNSNNSTYRNNNTYSEQRQQQEQQREENVNKMRESKESILGKKKD